MSDEMDRELNLIINGLTPDMIQFKSQELEKEFEQFKADLEDQNQEPLDDEQENMAYRSFVGHKLAAFQTTLEYIVKCLNEE